MGTLDFSMDLSENLVAKYSWLSNLNSDYHSTELN